jgi:hypothetical protein
MALHQRLESPRGEIEARALLAKLLGFRGQFDEAHQCASTNLRVSREHADPAGEYWSLTSLAEHALRSGGPAPAEVSHWLARAQALLSQHSFAVADVARGYGLLALAHQRAGDEQQAREFAQMGLRWLQRSKLAGVWTLDGIAALAEACLKLNVHTATVLQSLRDFARVFPIAGPRYWLLTGWQARQARQLGRARSAWRKSLNLAGQLAMPHEQGLARDELAQPAA